MPKLWECYKNSTKKKVYSKNVKITEKKILNYLTQHFKKQEKLSPKLGEGKQQSQQINEIVNR